MGGENRKNILTNGLVETYSLETDYRELQS